MAPQLEHLGDTEEQEHWPHLKFLIPHYEVFWGTYVFPLRAPGEIWLRKGLDPRLERMAMASYSAFTSFARARFKIFEDPEDYRHVEELYVHLQRAGELAVKMVRKFNELERSFLGRVGVVNVSALETFIDSKLKPYRNLVHDAKVAMPKAEGARMLPKLDKLMDYARWSETMFSFREEDFVSAESQVKSDFFATATTLEKAWKAMSEESDLLQQKSGFRQILDEGILAPVASATVPISASGDFSIGRPTVITGDAKEFVITPLPTRRRRK